MKGNRIAAMVISLICLASMAVSVSAQEPLNVSCLRQFEYNWHASVYDVSIEGDYAYLACDNEGLRIVNIAQPNAYFDVAHLDVGRTTAIAISGNYAYLGVSEENVSIVDISLKSNPGEVVLLPITGFKYAIRIYGNRAFICSTDGLTVLDISDPTAPVTVWNYPDYEIHDVAVSGNRAYVTCGHVGLNVFDITDISAPVLIDNYNSGDYNDILSVALYGNYAALASSWNGFQMIDLTTMEIVANIDSLYYALWVKVSGDYAYLAYGYPECPLAIINISNPVSPQISSIYYPPEDIATFSVVDDKVFVADYRHGLRIVDISDHNNAFECGRYNRFGFEYQVVIEGTTAYTQSEFKLTAIDISDPNSPAELGNFETNWEYVDFKIADNIGYILSAEPCMLYSVDFSNPASPTLLQQINPPYYDLYNRVALYDHYAFLLGWSDIVMVDISNPSQMTPVGRYETGNRANILRFFGHYAVIQNSNSELVILDIQNPLEPVEIQSYAISDRCYDLEIEGNTLYASTYRHLRIYDISEPANWQLYSITSIGNGELYNAQRLDLAGSLLYLASDEDGLFVYDVSSPTQPAQVGYYDSPGRAHDVAAHGNIAVVADHTNLGLYDCSAALSTGNPNETVLPQTITLLPNYPNPFNGSTVIRFEIGTQSGVSIDVIDMLGRQIAVLSNENYDVGRHSIRWDGTDAGGQVVSSGRYFVRAVSEGISRSLPITLLK